MSLNRFNLPSKKLRLRQNEGKVEVFDVLRKKWLILTPEEEVRQLFVHYMMEEKKYPAGLLALEYSLKVNSLKRRADVVAFNHFGHPLLLVECKAPSVKIDQKVFDQIARYNLSMKVDYLIVTNGLEHFCCQLDFQNQKYYFLQDIPSYDEIV
ncbi:MULTISPECIES: type I restriction enzyme HsdR N-terminal domain-containing protein [unclassified Lentimicrobium]|uniref:type I restriction enzyme HsdR N-terminal domain-containing protein n=1 Tax=unclassified Lentimicrobium TaxID=2677434 RepID=UPI001552C2EB|nr:MULTISPECIES: type I restriction enzyme HsdR N-terminal domain-containing protein [unclassified Lentimicrobium]NPD44766.1 type I restriction enzyme HsdR N-terminal domain-containing protein [Lentimicrobium sp. S6]NPD83378.1 type I restriction enzyme HsdR N-terminal domain-containing protein [Lentimicrobium sp. L6]